ncbi:DNA topoisomerase 3-beta-1 [Morus notabilis]|uniref:DNA topoisomerase n=1 Tax=Morus notabilis TaxID=981085 RepID=W9QV39_9ROSA|nr:DNA topoisomerase 3-beta-1 [Morus notabilis]
MNTRRSSTDVHEFDGIFLGFQAHYKVTSVIGHIFSVDFPQKYQDWALTDPLDLFEAPIVKNEANPKCALRLLHLLYQEKVVRVFASLFVYTYLEHCY